MLSIIRATVVAFVGLALMPMLARAQSTPSMSAQRTDANRVSGQQVERLPARPLPGSGS